MKKGYIIENMAGDMAYNIHVALRKYVEAKGSGEAWKAIGKIEGEGWLDACKFAAREIYPKFRKAIKEQSYGK